MDTSTPTAADILAAATQAHAAALAVALAANAKLDAAQRALGNLTTQIAACDPDDTERLVDFALERSLAAAKIEALTARASAASEAVTAARVPLREKQIAARQAVVDALADRAREIDAELSGAVSVFTAKHLVRIEDLRRISLDGAAAIREVERMQGQNPSTMQVYAFDDVISWGSGSGLHRALVTLSAELRLAALRKSN